MADFTSLIASMMRNPPDPNEPVPISNRLETIYGATIPFHALSWIAVLLRLHTRLRIIQQPGWDDLFVLLAALFNLVSMIAFLKGAHEGLGKHLIYLDASTLKATMIWLYIQYASYSTTASLIKISLICQYLRVFQKGFLNMTCKILLVLVSLWSVAFCFTAWVPCFPVSGLWNRMQTPAPKCYGIGYGSINGTKIYMFAFAGTNMILDTAIFLIPMIIYLKPGKGRKEILALTGLFAMGLIVVLMAVLRLWSVVKNNEQDIRTFDFTWWYPLTLIFSSLEVDFAIICASMPIFWPSIVASWSQIFVTKEVHVTHHRLEDDFEMNRPNSLKSNSSQEGLTRLTTLPKGIYIEQFAMEHATGQVPTTTEIEAPMKSRKRMN